MNQIFVAMICFIVVEDFSYADELRRVKDSGSVNFVTDKVDVVLVGEIQQTFQCISVQSGAQWI